jgi:hypothetical protein
MARPDSEPELRLLEILWEVLTEIAGGLPRPGLLLGPEPHRPVTAPALAGIDPTFLRERYPESVAHLWPALEKAAGGLDWAASPALAEVVNFAREHAELCLDDPPAAAERYLGAGQETPAQVSAQETVARILHWASIPLYVAAVEELQDVDLSAWDKGHCPYCGAPPAYGRLTAEEAPRRLLLCRRCSREWPAPRIACPSCETRDPLLLSFFVEEGREAHRVHTCDRCHTYLKVTNEKVLGSETVAVVEDVVTLHLDVHAQSRGYAPATTSHVLEL